MTNQVNSHHSKVTINDIARETGVSAATVSLALRDKPGISDETRQRIIAQAQALGYPIKQVEHHGGQTVRNVGVVVKIRPGDLPEDNYFYAPVLTGIEMMCRQQQANLLYANMPVDTTNNPLDIPHLLQHNDLDGLLLIGVLLNKSLQTVIKQRNIPAVLVDAYDVDNSFDSVVTDNHSGAFEATRHLIDNGHRHIAIVGSQRHSFPSIQERREGYARAIAQSEQQPHYIDCPLHPEQVVAPTLAYLEAHPEVTALFACNDVIAVAIMQALSQIGRQIPRDFSLIGFDNIVLAQHVHPALTTMRVDKLGMGRMAWQLLINRVAYPEASFVRAVICPHLIERASVKSITNSHR